MAKCPVTAARKVDVVNYGLGNIGSVVNMLRHIDIEVSLITTEQEVARSSRLLLPGVGSFDHGMTKLADSGLGAALVDRANQGVPLLGICLGMQMLAQFSAEGELPGLGMLAGSCHRLEPVDPRMRVPHMGWNWVRPARRHALTDHDGALPKFYFAHSFAMTCPEPEQVLAETDYGGVFASVAVAMNVCGAQFHPEKSHVFGMRFLSNFAKWSP